MIQITPAAGAGSTSMSVRDVLIGMNGPLPPESETDNSACSTGTVGSLF